MDSTGDPLQPVNPTPSFGAQGICGHMRIVCAPDSRGLPCLREQSFKSPIHLSKPFWDDSTLILNVVNPTAGLLEGDRITQEATVKSGARLVLTMPGASRAHRTRNGWAQVEQEFFIENGAFLEVLPEIFIPQAGSFYKQTTRIDVADGGELLFYETLAPGRTASGESFQYERLDWHTDLVIGGKQTVRERLRLEPTKASTEALRRHFPSAYYGSVLAVSPKFVNNLIFLEILDSMQNERVWIGQSRLSHSAGLSIKILAQTAPEMRLAMTTARDELHRKMGGRPSDLRRVAGR